MSASGKVCHYLRLLQSIFLLFAVITSVVSCEVHFYKKHCVFFTQVENTVQTVDENPTANEEDNNY